MLHSEANVSKFAGMTITSSFAIRGTGRSYWPNDRRDKWPIMEPAVMPIIIGPIMAISGAMKLRGSEGSGVVGVAGGVSEPARRSKSGRQDSSVVVAHCPRVTGTIEIPVPPKLVGSPVALSRVRVGERHPIRWGLAGRKAWPDRQRAAFLTEDSVRSFCPVRRLSRHQRRGRGVDRPPPQARPRRGT